MYKNILIDTVQKMVAGEGNAHKIITIQTISVRDVYSRRIDNGDIYGASMTM